MGGWLAGWLAGWPCGLLAAEEVAAAAGRWLAVPAGCTALRSAQQAMLPAAARPTFSHLPSTRPYHSLHSMQAPRLVHLEQRSTPQRVHLPPFRSQPLEHSRHVCFLPTSRHTRQPVSHLTQVPLEARPDRNSHCLHLRR